MTEPVSLEDLANEAVEHVDALQTIVQPARREFSPCMFCRGTGIDSSGPGGKPSPHAYLWLGNCWVCSGWGSVERGTLNLRGPFGLHPGHPSYVSQKRVA